MNEKTKKILNDIAKINDKNQILFNRKAKLEGEILEIDIEIFKLSGEYNEVCRRFLKEKK